MLRYLLLSVAIIALTSFSRADDFDKPITGKVQLQIGVHDFSLTPDTAYFATLSSKKHRHNFSWNLTDVNWSFDFTGGELPKGTFKEVRVFSPAKACKVTIRVEPSFDLPPGPHEYNLLIERRKLDPKPLLEKEGKLTNADVRVKGNRPYQTHKVKLVKGRVYVAEMSVGSKEFRVCPTFSYLGKEEDGTGFIAGDPGVALRSVFRPLYSGEYEVIASTFDDVSTNSCPYKLVLYQEANK